MKTALTGLRKETRRIIDCAGEIAVLRNQTAYVVGGFVRDMFLRRPNLDLDIVIEKDAPVFAGILAKKLGYGLKVHRQFKTATMFIPESGGRVDFTTARDERYPFPGSLPVVWPGMLRDDLFRRDFTINAMAVAIHPAHIGELFDPLGGLEDLQRKKIRVMHDKSFLDDPTRILRAVRFEQRFGFAIEPKTLRLLKSALKNKSVETVKAPRYFVEFRKMLREKSPSKCIRRLQRLRGLDFVVEGFHPGTKLMEAVEHEAARLKKLKMYGSSGWDLVYLMAFLGKTGESRCEDLAGRWQLSREETFALLASFRARSVAHMLDRKTLASGRVFQMLKGLPEQVLYYIRALCRSDRAGRRVDRFLEKDRDVKTRLTGTDLKKAGMVSGPVIGKILETLLLQKIDGKIRTVRDEWRAVRAMTETLNQGRGPDHGKDGKDQ